MVQNNANKIKCSKVVNLDDLKSYLKHFNDGTIYTIDQMDEIYNKLINAQSEMSNKEHVKNIKQTQQELKQGICPRCGGILVERDGQYGKFYGCSNYPKCRFILNKK